MQGIEINIVRSGQSEGRLLDEGAQYIAQCDDNPDVDLSISCSQAHFDDHIKLLRYSAGTDEQQRLAGIAFFQKLISRIFGDIYPKQTAAIPGKGFLHVRLVTNHKEIAQLPFELALTPAQPGTPMPFLLNPTPRATLTREVRQARPATYAWPSDPRILFAWAQPGNTVPHDKHLDAFMTVLRRWALPLRSSPAPVPDAGHLLTELRNASLSSIKAAIAAARAEGRPYTHIHLLAHGATQASADTGQFEIILNDEQRRPQKVSGYDLAEALTERTGDVLLTPQIVSLIACDSGNIGSPVGRAGSLAHELHEAGIPCVFASQFPLTQVGSVNLIQALYDQLLQSSDPRVALYQARQVLNAAGTHDWASLVAYARFPKDIDEQMKDIGLKIMLLFMKTANALADHVLRHIKDLPADGMAPYFKEVADRLNSAIDSLTGLIGSTEENEVNKDRYAEHYGLIGSAYKRKAEHLYRTAVYQTALAAQGADEAKEALTQARDWYRKGFDKVLNSHWNGTQYLCLLALLGETGTDDDAKEVWMVCKRAAAQDEKNADNDESLAWTYGTLAELYLLKPIIYDLSPEKSEASLGDAATYLKKLTALTDQAFPKESTARQLERYIHWWPAMLPSARTQCLATRAQILRSELPGLDTAP